MLRWFERRFDPYPSADPVQPPATMLGFFLFYLRGAKRWLLLMATLTAVIALSEVVMFGFIGNIVDWLGKADRATFLETQGWQLLLMALFVRQGVAWKRSLLVAVIATFLIQFLFGYLLRVPLPRGLLTDYWI